ncbi:MAG: SDR family NAD(P)-dependent oxidoreductase [Bacteroidia bacterium]|nr:SDR family NAD(P)-dependent oxidoreductase [Bacteroidia bacterium]
MLINNAGIMLLLDTGNEANDLTKQFAEIEINFNSPIRLVHYFLPQLKKSKEAVIVNVSSGLAYVHLCNCQFDRTNDSKGTDNIFLSITRNEWGK